MPTADRLGTMQMKLAVDTQILPRNAARRMVFGSAELVGAHIIVPETAAYFAKIHYAKVSRHYIEDQVEWDDATNATEWSDKRISEEVAKRLGQAVIGFQNWIDQEAQRNDGAFTIGTRSQTATVTAMEIARAGVVIDPKDKRWEIGEDPYVLAEALEAGAQWIASDNFETLVPRAMEDWLDTVQRAGRFLHVPRPFILSAEEAIDHMLHTAKIRIEQDQLSGRELRRGLANAVSKPNRPDTSTPRRVQILAKMGNDIRNAGLGRTGREIHQWKVRKLAQIRNKAEEKVSAEIAWMDRSIGVNRVSRTRAAEDRRIRSERPSKHPKHPTTPTTPPTPPGGIGL